jgi:hypothetical protein
MAGSFSALCLTEKENRHAAGYGKYSDADPRART